MKWCMDASAAEVVHGSANNWMLVTLTKITSGWMMRTGNRNQTNAMW